MRRMRLMVVRAPRGRRARGAGRCARPTRGRSRLDPVRKGKSNIEYGKCDGILVNIDYNNGIWQSNIDYNAYSGIRTRILVNMSINVSNEYPLAALKGRAKLPGTLAFAQVGTAPCGFPLWFPHSSSSYSLSFLH
jgi:hypothetical protein